MFVSEDKLQNSKHRREIRGVRERRVEIFDRVVGKGLTEKAICEKVPQEVKSGPCGQSILERRTADKRSWDESLAGKFE